MGQAPTDAAIKPFYAIRLPNKYVDWSFDQNKNRYKINIII